MVDDGSDPPLAADARTAHDPPADQSRAGAARNAGLAEVTTPLVAFVDTDVDLRRGLARHRCSPTSPIRGSPSSLRGCASTAAGDGARRVRSRRDRHSTSGPSRAASPPARGSATCRPRRWSCAPTSLRAIGGFDEAMRTGEDVDLVWRLIEAGHRCRYEPAVTVHHRPRRHCRRGSANGSSYGRSAATLDRRHPGAVAPLRMSGWSAAVWALVLARRPLGRGDRRCRNDRRPAPQARTTFRRRNPFASPGSATSTPAARSPAPSPARGGRSHWSSRWSSRGRGRSCSIARHRRAAAARLARDARPERSRRATSRCASPTTSPTEPGCGSGRSSNAASARWRRSSRIGRGEAAG